MEGGPRVKAVQGRGLELRLGQTRLGSLDPGPKVA